MAKRLQAVPFRYDDDTHTYWMGDQLRPNVTGLLKLAGWVDDSHYTEEGRRRGKAVHRMTADYDLGGLDVDRLVSPYRPYVLAHVALVKRIKPKFLLIEEPVMHPIHGFGCTCDRVAKLYGAIGTVDQKTGAPERWHGIQTALQVVCVSWKFGIAPAAMQRYSEYLRLSGYGKLEKHPKRADLDEAYRIIKKFC